MPGVRRLLGGEARELAVWGAGVGCVGRGMSGESPARHLSLECSC